MAVSESQLDTWSKQGSVTQSQQTYASVRGVLNGSDAAYHHRSYSIFLQGSYGNDTNIYADSDVDVVIATDSVYYSDTSKLSEDQTRIHNSSFTLAEYQYVDFKRDVLEQLLRHYGADVDPGKKAIRIKGNQSRRDADVLAAAEHRDYTGSGQNYHTGIVFWTADGTKIVNYPKQHSENCTRKHQNTSSWFKPSVRILKNMRNRMISDGLISADVAPSYFLEGMLYNVPDGNFGVSYMTTIANSLNWLRTCERDKLVCANERYFLLHPTSPVTWRAEKMETYIEATIRFWNAW
jgi:hypothetical protein